MINNLLSFEQKVFKKAKMLRNRADGDDD